MKQFNVKYLLGTAIIVAFVAAIVLPLSGLEWSAQADGYINAGERAVLDANNVTQQIKTGCGGTFYLKTDGTMELWYTDANGNSTETATWNNPGGGTATYNPGGIRVVWNYRGTNSEGNRYWQVNLNCRNGDSTSFEIEQDTEGGRSLHSVGS